MKIKWVCPVCSTTNICEKTERMRCFVCGSYYEESPYIFESSDMSESSAISESPHIAERHDLKLSDGADTKPGVRKKINNFIKKIKSSLGPKETDRPKRKLVDWEIGHSPSDSKEAYVEATPIYEEISDHIPEADIPEDIEIDRDSTERIGESEPIAVTTIPDELSEDITPWAEHEFDFDFSKLRSTGCVDIKKEDIHGNKCYKLFYKNGSEKILPLTSMKMMGYLVKCSSEIYSGKSSADIRSFIPWPEHRIVFDMEKLNATGCINVERTEVSGSKYYKLTYRNGTERIMNISNLKLVRYVRDM